MALVRTIVWFCYFFGALIAFIPVMFRAKKKCLAGDADASDYIKKYVYMWAGTLMKIAGVTVTVEGRENIPKDTAVMFTPNHQGDYDIPLMLLYLDRPHGLVAKAETKKIPFVRTWMTLLNCVFLDRSNPRKAMEAMREAEALLERGESMVVFPEGTRSRGDHMNEFKAGAFKMACKAKVPVVPVAIDGSYRIMEANGGLMKPAHVRVLILPPIETASLDRAEQRALPQRVAQLIAEVKSKA